MRTQDQWTSMAIPRIEATVKEDMYLRYLNPEGAATRA